MMIARVTKRKAHRKITTMMATILKTMENIGKGEPTLLVIETSKKNITRTERTNRVNIMRRGLSV